MTEAQKIEQQALPERRGPGRPPGERSVIIDDAMITRIETVAGLGLNLGQIAAYVGVSRVTFDRYRKEHPRIDDAIDRGKAVAIAAVAQTAYKMATNGKNPGMTAFFLKCRAGWQEKNKLDITHNVKTSFVTQIGADGVLKKVVADKQDIGTEEAEALYNEFPETIDVEAKPAEPIEAADGEQ